MISLLKIQDTVFRADEVISVELVDTNVTVWLRGSTPEDGYEFEFDTAQLAARGAAQFIMQWGSIAR